MRCGTDYIFSVFCYQKHCVFSHMCNGPNEVQMSGEIIYFHGDTLCHGCHQGALGTCLCCCMLTELNTSRQFFKQTESLFRAP